MQSCRDYIHALQEERRKIQVFERELPLCLDLVTQAIETYKQHFSDTTTTTEIENNPNSQSECSTGVPVFEEFIPIKRPSSSSQSDGEEQESSKKPRNDGNNLKKSDWLRSVHLWNQTPPAAPTDVSSEKNSEVKSNGGGAFQPFKKDEIAVGTIEAPPPLSTAEAATGNKKEEKEGHCQRKTRRSWSPELHRRFLHALQQVGGSQVATPKQIRELMKVDGLTNDEVKSHLQKYRLHARRPTSSIQMNNGTTETPQFVVVRGIWVSPDYATMATTAVSSEASDVGTGTSNEIYAPIAMLPPSFREASISPKKGQCKSDDTGNHNGDRCEVQTHSQSTSSSPSC